MLHTMTDNQKLGAYIRTARKQSGVSLPALAVQAGISKGLLSRIERGMGNPSWTTLLSIGHAMGETVAFGKLKG